MEQYSVVVLHTQIGLGIIEHSFFSVLAGCLQDATEIVWEIVEEHDLFAKKGWSTVLKIWKEHK